MSESLEGENWHPSVIAMANAMQEKLERNASKDNWPKNKKGKRGWMPPVCDSFFLMDKLYEEVRELNEARLSCERINHGTLIDGTDAKVQLRLEAADVANIAMMIADNLGAYSDK